MEQVFLSKCKTVGLIFQQNKKLRDCETKNKKPLNDVGLNRENLLKMRTMIGIS